MREKVIRDSRDGLAGRQGARGEINGANTKDTIDAVETLSCTGNADGLVLDDQARPESDSISDWSQIDLTSDKAQDQRLNSHSFPENWPEP